MSSFRRTTSGLNNQHLFYNVDIIVFLEGGNVSFSKADVLSGRYHEETEDIIFWRNIFNHFRNNQRIKFKSVGSKTTIKEIAIDVINGVLATVCVAMDNEFDEIFNNRIEHPNVFYTHGYSWENDVWNETVIKSVIEELSAIKISNNDIEDNFQKFIRNIKAAVNADGYLFSKNSSFFPRQGLLFCVECNIGNLPYIRTVDINSRFTLKRISRATANAYGRRKGIETHKHCFGHLLADYFYQVVRLYLRTRHNLTGISKDIVYRMAINKFFQRAFDGDIYTYYQQQFSNQNVA